MGRNVVIWYRRIGKRRTRRWRPFFPICGPQQEIDKTLESLRTRGFEHLALDDFSFPDLATKEMAEKIGFENL